MTPPMKLRGSAQVLKFRNFGPRESVHKLSAHNEFLRPGENSLRTSVEQSLMPFLHETDIKASPARDR